MQLHQMAGGPYSNVFVHRRKNERRRRRLWLVTHMKLAAYMALASIVMTPLSHRPKQSAIFAWGQQSGAWGRAGNANLLGVKAALLGVCLR